MAKSRMAGDALRAKREKARERIGNDPERLAERLSVVDRDAYDFSGYSDKDINMALQGETFGDEDYARLTGGGSNNPTDDVVEDTSEPTDQAKPDDSVNIDFGNGGSPFVPEIAAPGSGAGQTVFQDNDQQSSIVGDNNTVTQNQDNSVSGGSYAKRGQLFKDDFMKAYFS